MEGLSTSPFHHLSLSPQSLTSIQQHLPAVLFLAGRSKHPHHPVAGFVHRQLGLVPESQAPRAGVAQVRLHPAGPQDKRVQPVVLGVDPDREPVGGRLGRPVRGVRDGGLVPVLMG